MPVNLRLVGLLAVATVGCNGRVISFSLPPSGPPEDAGGSFVRDAELAMPADLPMTCQGPLSNVTLMLPCAIGMSPLFATECYLSGMVDRSRPAIGFISPLEEMSRRLYEPWDLAGFVITPSGVTPDATAFDLAKVEGTAIFYEVDPVQRSFTGRLQKLTVSWTSDAGDTITCGATDAPFWAVPGNFL